MDAIWTVISGIILALSQGWIMSTHSINCQDGWVTYHTSCYLFPRNHKSTFTEAEHYCRQHGIGSHLVELETRDEDLFVRDFLRGMKAEYRWMGLTDEKTEGIWKWYNSDTVPAYTDWYPGEPNSSGEEDCGMLDAGYDYSWIDWSCSNKAEPICEINSEYTDIVGK